jgi:hypothetical protein
MKKFLIIVLSVFPFLCQAQLTGIGEWTYHLSFTSAYNIAQNDTKVFVASGTSVYTIEKESLESADFSKLNALSDVGVSCLSYDENSDYLFVGYQNGNIDLIKDGITFNLSDIKRSGSVIGSKQINDAYFYEDDIYLSTGFGLVIISLEKREVKSTTLLGPDGTEAPVYRSLIFNDSLYAAAENGLMKIDVNNPFLSNFEFWIRDETFPIGGEEGPINQLTVYQDKLYANYRNDQSGNDDIIYRKDSLSWVPIVDNKTVLRMKGSDYGLLVVALDDVTLKKENGSNIHGFYTYEGIYHKPQDAVIGIDSTIYIPNLSFGVILDEWDSSRHVLLNGPYKDLAWKTDMHNNHLWVAGGKVTGSFGKEYNVNGVYHYHDGNWTNVNRTNSDIIDDFKFNDVISIANDVNNPDVSYAGSYGKGLIEIRGDTVSKIWNYTNMEEHSLNKGEFGSDTNFIGVSGLTIDLNGNLWISNPLNSHPVSVKTPSGEWKNFSFGNELSGNLKLSDITNTVRSNIKWIIRPRAGILTFDDGGTPLDTSDDQYKALSDAPGKGNLPSLFVGAIAEDLDGEIWVGTESGPAVFYSPTSIFSGGNYDCRQILIEQDGNVQILLETESITAISIDGGNRKWLGTANNGVFLLSPDGTEQIHHFTSENSPLLSNTIFSISIDNLTGEVFFGTGLGIVSYRSDAVSSNSEMEELLVFPNPVRQDYFGPIAINGTYANSEVKITDSNGNAVNQLVSEGGQAIWDGTNFNGERVATGVYFIFSSDESGEYKTSGKVLIIK